MGHQLGVSGVIDKRGEGGQLNASWMMQYVAVIREYINRGSQTANLLKPDNAS
jgi:hypothetical protein